MSRKTRAYKLKVPQDSRFRCYEVAKFINIIMKSGNKARAESIVYSALTLINVIKSKALRTFLQAVENVKPVVEVKSRKLGGATYKVPVEVKSRRRIALALRWIKHAAQSRKERTMDVRVYKEIMEAVNRKGAAIKRRDEVHKLAENNRSFAHFRC